MNNLPAFGLTASDLSATAIVDSGIENVRRSAIVLCLAVAAELETPRDFANAADLKAWAQSVNYADLSRALSEFGKGIAYALARRSVGEPSKRWADSFGKLIARTFPCLGKVSVRHDASRKTDPVPSNGIDPETFSFMDHQGTFGAFGFAPKSVKAKSHVTDSTGDSTAVHTDLDPVPASLPVPEGMAPNARGDLRFTLDGTAMYANQQVATALALRDSMTVSDHNADKARIRRLARISRALRDENRALKVQLAALTAAPAVVAAPATARKATARKAK